MSDTGAQDIAQIEHEHHIKINYKSGNNFTGWFSVFEYTHENDKIMTITATHCDGQKLLIIGMDHIESIVKLESRKIAVQK